MPRSKLRSFAAVRLLRSLHVLCLRAFLALRHIELHAFTLGERSMPLGDDRGLVDEYVLAVVLLNEPEALRVVEPLHCTGSHET
jgi:hypothetical protein